MLMKGLSLCIAVAMTGCAAVGQRGAPYQDATGTGAAAQPPAKLTVYSGGHVRKALAQVLRIFEQREGCAVDYVAGASGKQLDQAMTDREADLYVAADLRNIRAAERKDLVTAKLPIAFLRLAIVVKKGNPRKISRLEDLAHKGVRVFVEPPAEGCQVGQATRDLLIRNNIRLTPTVAKMDAEPPNLRTVAGFIKADLLDAAIVWDSVAAQIDDELDTVAIPPERNVQVNIVAVQLRSSPSPALAERLMLFLRSPAARAVLERHGFRTQLP